MPMTLQGTGGTKRDQLLLLAMDAYAKGHTVVLGGHYRPETARQMQNNATVSSLVNETTGNALIVCGFTEMGDTQHVCGS